MQSTQAKRFKPGQFRYEKCDVTDTVLMCQSAFYKIKGFLYTRKHVFQCKNATHLSLSNLILLHISYNVVNIIDLMKSLQ